MVLFMRDEHENLKCKISGYVKLHFLCKLRIQIFHMKTEPTTDTNRLLCLHNVLLNLKKSMTYIIQTRAES